MSNGAAEIVLLPGLDGTGDLFDRVAPLLNARLSVDVMRYPQDPTLGYAGYAELVRNYVGTRSVFLLGELFSGPVAIRVATQLGAQIRGVVSVATFVENPWPAWLIRWAARVDPKTTPSKIRDAILMGEYADAELTSKVDEIVRTISRPVRAARLSSDRRRRRSAGLRPPPLPRPRAARAQRLACSEIVDAESRQR